ncbi:DUF3789 domain-containing protein [Thermoanaerobacterium thermosaccharolyticum]
MMGLFVGSFLGVLFMCLFFIAKNL